MKIHIWGANIHNKEISSVVGVYQNYFSERGISFLPRAPSNGFVTTNVFCSISSSKSNSLSFNLHGCYFYSSKNCLCCIYYYIHKNSSHVLLGMFELDLQQLATDLGQQKYRGKQLHQLLYKSKVMDIQDLVIYLWHLGIIFKKLDGRLGDHQCIRCQGFTPTVNRASAWVTCTLSVLKPIETFTIPVEYDKGSIRLTICVSSQLGCPVCNTVLQLCFICSINVDKHNVAEVSICKSAKQMSTISTVEGWHLPNSNPPCLSAYVLQIKYFEKQLCLSLSIIRVYASCWCQRRGNSCSRTGRTTLCLVKWLPFKKTVGCPLCLFCATGK
ncbi:hypothetical protein MKW98_008552 [Papaver atlanticum]|uniref:Uncharacterized protein n=1 Tax=Papaver atlanticum TaxID=357466 RepID=A0AAD4TCR8_9MAGN|nr:hypothetical protein MKW98_008552 [Papaver atlanticum]